MITKPASKMVPLSSFVFWGSIGQARILFWLLAQDWQAEQDDAEIELIEKDMVCLKISFPALPEFVYITFPRFV